MSKQENIYYVYEFLYEFKDKLSKEDKNKLVSKIVNSREMKLIVLVAVFIDVKLIEKLFKSKKELFIFAVGLNAFTLEEITKLSGADSLGYLPVESLHEMINYAPIGFCDGCFTGNYPAPITKETFKGKERGGMNFDKKKC